MLRPITYAQMTLLNAHDAVSSKVRGLNFGLSLHKHPYFAYASSKGSGESAYTPEHSLLADPISTEISCIVPFVIEFHLVWS